MSTFLWILLILVIIIVIVLGYFYYQGATYVPPKVDSTAKSTDSSDSSKSISELVPKSPEKSLSDKIAEKKREFQNASTADKTKMLLKGAVLLSPVGLAAYGGSKLIKKMKEKKAKSANTTPSASGTTPSSETPVETSTNASS
jgi:cytoskeletal protein RodZ